MFSSTRIGRFFGIDFYIHSTFWLLPLLVLFTGVASGGVNDAVLDTTVILAAFGCVALHEVGHALAARSYGIRTRDITLYPIGGVASLESMPRNPWQEIVVALAGPAVNLVIAGGLFVGMLAGSFGGMVSAYAEPSFVQKFLGQLLVVNVGLLLFNLIPAFPMDGGRVLRALLATRMGRLRATEVAASVATVIAVGFALQGFGIINILPFGSSFMLVFLAAVIYFLGQGELLAVRRQEAGNVWQRDYRPYAEPDVRVSRDSFSGWTWDPARRVWSEWRHGRVVREVSPV